MQGWQQLGQELLTRRGRIKGGHMFEVITLCLDAFAW